MGGQEERRAEDGEGIGRRGVLRLGLGALFSLAPTGALARTRVPAARALAFDNLHTGERLSATYWEQGRYLSDALGEINRLLRDFRTDEVCEMDTRLLDLLWLLRTALGSRRAFQVVSGYRSPATNAMLRAEGHDVAEASLHTFGQAVDIRLPDRRLSTLRRAAIRLRRGGVGYYPRSRFVHVDVGGVRRWGAA